MLISRTLPTSSLTIVSFLLSQWCSCVFPFHIQLPQFPLPSERDSWPSFCPLLILTGSSSLLAHHLMLCTPLFLYSFSWYCPRLIGQWRAAYPHPSSMRGLECFLLNFNQFILVFTVVFLSFNQFFFWSYFLEQDLWFSTHISQHGILSPAGIWTYALRAKESR